MAAIALGLAAEDRDAGLEVGGLHVGHEPPLEPVPQPVLERGDRLGRPVGGDDDLAGRAVEAVEGVEELLLGPFLVLEKLDVVDQEDVHLAIAALEGGGRVVADRVDELVREGLGGHVAHVAVRVVLAHVVPDGVEQVGLAQP